MKALTYLIPLVLVASMRSDWSFNSPSSNDFEFSDSVNLPLPAAAEPVPKLELQSCIADLEKPQVFVLSSEANRQSYYMAFPAINRTTPIDMRQVDSLRTIFVTDISCQVLTQAQAQALADQLLNSRYRDLMVLWEGDIDAAWGDIVNQWERDHAVSGPGEHPLYLDSADIWIAKTLNLHLPDYIPVHINSPIRR
ncbi:hypothetical protein PN498_19420 [Oscillatoria sp. CS-180]|uniref:hypothetical protein n=1 Tax=Oscillatoria sp. CS-180 TaxID=3021720 RepID=UPI00233144FE|nr:hypothetical protein [Oscillatoria sp. CS-180]MDB9528171.1 hypothetical protein [Oscillatoria sp. CS-180]